MYRVIDAFSSTSGWSTDGALTFGTTTEPAYLAGLQPAALVVSVPAGSIGKTFEKTITPGTASLTDYLSLHTASLYQPVERPWQYADFNYRITFVHVAAPESATTFGLRAGSELAPAKIATVALTSAPILKIRITVNHNGEDALILSNLIAARDERPLDIYNGLIAQYAVETARAGLFKAQTLGTLAGTAAAKTGTYTATARALFPGMVIDITEGAVTERHQVKDVNGTVITFWTTFDGATLVNSFTTGTVTLVYYVTNRTDAIEAMIPGVFLDGGQGVMVRRGGRIDYEYDTFKSDGSCYYRPTGNLIDYTISLNVEARSSEDLANLAELTRRMFGNEVVWINGMKHELREQGAPQDVNPTEGFDIVPKQVYTLNVELKGETQWPGTRLIPATSISTTVTPEAMSVP